MTKDELKRKLKSAWYLHSKHLAEIERLEEKRSIAAKVTPAYSLAPGGSSDGKAMENAIVRILEQEQRINQSLAKLAQQEAEVEALIELLPNSPVKIVLRRRYLNYQKWERIAEAMSYSYQHVHKLHGQGLMMLLNRVNGKKHHKQREDIQQHLF